MCTCLDFKSKDHYFGRNLDLEYRFNENVVITPRNYSFCLKNGTELKTKYALIGMATLVGTYPLYAEATNEKGLSMAGLNFPGNAYYFEMDETKLNITSFELIPYFLGQYQSIAEMREDLERLKITNVSFAKGVPASPLHWMVSDDKECIVVEQMKDGLKVWDNPIGVLTNNPPFSFHLENMNNYMDLSPRNFENRFSSKLDLKPYGVGMGAMGMPGDTSPTSRFIRAAFNKLNSVCDEDELSSVTQFFHVLDSVAMVEGATITMEGKCDITTYSCCINMNKGIYYYKTYSNNQITAIRMNEKEMNCPKLTVFDLVEEQQIRYEN